VWEQRKFVYVKRKKHVKCPLCGYGFFLWTPDEEVCVICSNCGYEYVV